MTIRIEGKGEAEIAAMVAAQASTASKVIRTGLSLLRLILAEQKRGNIMVIATKDGEPLREIKLPDLRLH